MINPDCIVVANSDEEACSYAALIGGEFIKEDNIINMFGLDQDNNKTHIGLSLKVIPLAEIDYEAVLNKTVWGWLPTDIMVNCDSNLRIDNGHMFEVFNKGN